MASSVAKQILKKRSFYEVLGVSRLSKTEEVRSAYLELAKKYHPDAVSASSSSSVTLSQEDAAGKFREVQEAYSTLSNQWKRTLYDQDLQFQSALSTMGEASAAGDVAAWRQNFNVETPEARIARRERYKRYAAGERNDQPPVQLTTKGSLLGLVFCGVVLTAVCAEAPNWFSGQDEMTFHDPLTDDHSVVLVRAFYNPISSKWERLTAEQAVPTLEDIVKEFKRIAPRLVEQWLRAQEEEGNTVAAINTLTEIRVPKTRTIPATVYRDSQGDVKVNRRTISDTISRFINRT